jgi:cytoskeletal protein CcmA (bactofilin family)
MFKKRETSSEDIQKSNNEQRPINYIPKQKRHQQRDINTILKGSKLTGDINVSYDLELSGEVEGNIHAEKNSSIAIKGVCRGDIRGRIEAKGRIYVNGEFDGKLEGNEIEIGSNSQGRGELFYKDSISIAKGAKVEVQINQIKESIEDKKEPEKEPEDVKVVLELPSKDENKITIH